MVENALQNLQPALILFVVAYRLLILFEAKATIYGLQLRHKPLLSQTKRREQILVRPNIFPKVGVSDSVRVLDEAFSVSVFGKNQPNPNLFDPNRNGKIQRFKIRNETLNKMQRSIYRIGA